MAGIFTSAEAAALETRAIEKYASDIYAPNIYLSRIGRKKLGGKRHEFSVKLGGSGVSRSYSTGSANAVVVGRVEGVAVPQEVFSFAMVNGPGARSAAGKGDSRVDLFADAESDARGRGAMVLQHLLIMGRGYGEMSYVSSVTGTTGAVTVTLVNRRDARLYKAGDVITAAATPDAALDAASVTLTKVDVGTGILSGNASGGSVAAWAGYAIAISGMLSNNSGRVAPMGLVGLLTRTAGDLAAAAIQGLPDRTTDAVMLAGHNFSLGTSSVEDAVDTMYDEITTISGADPDLVLISTDKWRQLQQDRSEKQFEIISIPGRGFDESVFSNKALAMLTSKGKKIAIIGSPDVNNTDIFMLDTDWIDWVSPFPVPFASADMVDRGWFSLAPAGTDAYKNVLVATGEQVCTAFGFQGHGTFTS